MWGPNVPTQSSSQSPASLTDCNCDFFWWLGALDSQFNSEPYFPRWFHRLGLHAALSCVAVAPQICSNCEPARTFGRCGHYFVAGLFQNTIFWMGLDYTHRTLRVFALVLAGEASRQIRSGRGASERRASSVALAAALHAHLRDGGINR